jgi:osmotically-inducible protein OsmY
MARDERASGFVPGWTAQGAGDAPLRPAPFDLRSARDEKGWRRPDRSIAEEVAERVALCGAASDDVEIRVEHGLVTLTGTAPSRDDRRLIEEVASEVFGVVGVLDRIRIAEVARGEPH